MGKMTCKCGCGQEINHYQLVHNNGYRPGHDVIE